VYERAPDAARAQMRGLKAAPALTLPRSQVRLHGPGYLHPVRGL